MCHDATHQYETVWTVKNSLNAEDWAQAALDAIAEGGIEAVAVEPLAEVARPAPVPFSIGPNIGSALLTERLKQVAATRNSRAVRDECQSVCASRASA